MVSSSIVQVAFGAVNRLLARQSAAEMRHLDGKALRVGYFKVDVMRLARDRRGVTALEYGIIASFFCVVLVTIFLNFGSTLTKMMSGVDTAL